MKVKINLKKTNSMIERTVTIGLDEYNQLRDFKSNVLVGNCVL